MKSIKLVTENTYLMGYNGNNVACCYYPLTKETKELDLPLLPNPFKEDEFQKSYQIVFNYVNSGIRNYEAMMELIELKKIAQSKQFSLEDVGRILKARENYLNNVPRNSVLITIDEYLQSLSTQQLPKEFVLGIGNTIEEQIKNGEYIW